uniref:RNA-directed DNA polymerase n=1 Tax=Pyricularia oryzae TaxID=318829 RepID=A9ZPI7_PYROR|nr:pol polyprotein [Pyricularia oryzae]
MPQIAKIDRSPKLNTFLAPIQLQDKGRGLNAQALCDTGADVYLSIRPSLAKKVAQRLELPVKKLPKPLDFGDFNRKVTARATEYLRLTLQIDGRQFPRQKFILLETAHDVFIGQEWWTKHRVGLFPATRSFVWPNDLPAMAQYSPAIVVQRSNPPLDLEAQTDAVRRDRKMEQEDRRIQVRKILQGPKRQHGNQAQITEISAFPTIPKTVSNKALPANICALLNDPRQDRWKRSPLPTEPIPLVPVNDTPTTSLNAVLALQWNKTHDGHPIPFPAGEDPEHIAQVRAKLPKALAHLEGFFSKKASTILPPSRPGFDVVLELEKPLEGRPARYSTPFAMMELEKETIDELLRIDFIERTMEETAASTLFVPKPQSKEQRFCVDYRWVNKFIKGRQVLAPDVAGTLSKCGKARRMTKIDIIRAFNRLLMDPNSRYLTAFKTRQGTFQWKVLPFGLKVGPAWFQAFINAQLNELLDAFASAYADDVLIYTEDKSEQVHFEQTEEVIYRLHKAGLQGDIKKSSFGVFEIEYLGLLLEIGKGIRIDPKKVEAITSWQWDDVTSVSAVRSFLGLCNFVRTFCHHASEQAEPLTRLLKKGVPFEKGPEQKAAFEALKQLVVTAPVMSFFKPGMPVRMDTDASGRATAGVVWQQQDDGSWKPIGYSSKTMSPAEQNYPIQDQELLAVINTLKDFEPALLGTKFCVFTDHQALIYWSTKKLLSARQIRWADYLANFDITFKYRPGKDNVAADALSRKTVDNPTVKARAVLDRTMALIPPEKINFQPGEPPPTINNLEPSAPQGADLVALILEENLKQNLGRHDSLLTVPETTQDGKIFLRTALIREAHEPKIFGHGGQNKTLSRLKKDYWWPDRNRDVKRYIKNCRECQRNKVRHDKTPGLLHPLEIPRRCWQHVMVDGKDMPKDKEGYNYVWVFICRLTKLLATLPGKKTDTAETLAMRYYQTVYRWKGVPDLWLSDNAGPFISEFLNTLNELTGTKHKHGSARHPQSQGSVEITNAELDQKMRFYVDKYQTNWRRHIPAFDFGHNSSVHASIGMAPIEAETGARPRDPLSLPLPEEDLETGQQQKALEMVRQARQAQELARNNGLGAQIEQQRQANKKLRPVDFTVGDAVYVSKKGFSTEAPTTKLDSQNAGPWTILGEKGHSFILDTPAWYKGSKLFHASRLRKAATDPLPQQYQKPEPPVEINGEPEWEVEQVLASRLFGRKKTLQYQVSWVGLDPDETWYEARDLKNSPVLLDTFHREYPDAAGPPVNLQQWIRSAAEDIFAEDGPEDNVAEHDAKETRERRKAPRRHT